METGFGRTDRPVGVRADRSATRVRYVSSLETRSADDYRTVRHRGIPQRRTTSLGLVVRLWCSVLYVWRRYEPVP